MHEQLHFLVYLCDSGIIWLHYSADCKLSTYAFFDLKMHRPGNCIYETVLILWATCCSTWYIFDFTSRVFEQTAGWTLLPLLYYKCETKEKRSFKIYCFDYSRTCRVFQIYRHSSQIGTKIPRKKNNVRVTNLIELGGAFHKIKWLMFIIHYKVFCKSIWRLFLG